MSEKKHKGGYELLKEKYNEEVREHKALETKYAALVKERDELKQEIERRQEEKEILVQTAQDNYIRMEKERDEWKAKYEQKCASAKLFENETTRLHGIIEEADKRIAFLLDHCPFWVRWLYRKQFKKGGKG